MKTQTERESCTKNSAWVATGTISDVVHRVEGPPLSMDFAEFTFNVETWEKKLEGLPMQVRLRVHWCSLQLPTNTEGVFRFYSQYKPENRHSGNGYLYFEKISDQK